MKQQVPLVISFAASDPTSGAGSQADVLTLAALGVHPLTVLTGLTAQNSVGVQRFEPLGSTWVRDQLRVLLEDNIQLSAIKAGVLGSVAAVKILSSLKKDHPQVPLVVDPVRASGRGDAFGRAGVWSAMRKELLPLVDLLTPNWPEAQAMTECDTPDEAAQALFSMGCKAILIKGEHHPSEHVVNRLYQAPQQAAIEYPCVRLPEQYHGSGCTLASACAAGLAQGLGLQEAVTLGLEFTWHALKHGFTMGQGQLIPDRLHLMQQLA